MKAFILSIAIAGVVLLSCKPDNRIVQEYPDAGMKEIYSIDKDSLIHGEKLVYLENGEFLYSKSNYDRGQLSGERYIYCLLYTSPSPRDATLSRMPSSA